MKYLAAVFVLAGATANAAPPQPPVAPQPDLRRTLQQYHDVSATAPRQLTAAERAELRRQLIEFRQVAPPPQKRR